jgi:hypothetical protein
MLEQQFQEYYQEYAQKLQTVTTEVQKLQLQFQALTTDVKQKTLIVQQLSDQDICYSALGKAFIRDDQVLGGMKGKVESLSKDQKAMEVIITKKYTEKKDIERNLDSLIEKAKKDGLIKA